MTDVYVQRTLSIDYTVWVGLAPITSHCNSEVNLHTCSKRVTTGSDSDLNETSLSRDVMAVDTVE